MIPSGKLMFYFGVIVVPLATIGAMLPSWAPWSALLVTVLAALVVTDAALSRSALEDLVVRFPAITRLMRDREGAVEMHILNPTQLKRQIRVGLLFPPGLVPAAELLELILPAGTESSAVTWICAGHRRGRYVLDTCALACTSRLGFWQVRRRLRVNGEVRVYPNLMRERQQLAALFLRRGSTGVHAQRQLGKGREFEKLREYVPGDSSEDIHWKATAKRGHPVTKLFQVERTQEVYVVIDASRLNARRVGDGTGETMLERYVTSALVLAVAAERQGDLFGLITFSDRVQGFVRAKSGKSHHTTCREALYTLQPQTVTPDFDEVCAFIRTRLRRRALLVWLTSLDDPVLAESFSRNMDLICRQHLILVNMLRPAGARPLFADGNVNTADDVYRHLSGHFLWNRLRELETSLGHRGVSLRQLDDERLSAQLVSEYASVKQRQLL